MLLLLALACLISPSWAHDLGEDVTFAGRPMSTLAFESGPSDALGPFEAVLLQGLAPDEHVSISVSVQSGTGWSEWIPASLTRYENGRFWAKADTGRSRGRVRLRALGAGTAKLEIFGIEAVIRSAEKGGRANAVPPAPAPDAGVHRRAEWSAKPPLSPFIADGPYRLTVHHTQGARTLTWEDGLIEMRLIQDFHQRGRGWIDIGYHFVIDGAGRVFEGRPQTVVGAHTLANNDGNIGVSFMGDTMKQDPTPEQFAAFLALGRRLVSTYGISPAILRGHRDYKSTDCPGDRLYALLPDLRKALAEPAR